MTAARFGLPSSNLTWTWLGIGHAEARESLGNAIEHSGCVGQPGPNLGDRQFGEGAVEST
jgi:hypothetical protein